MSRARPVPSAAGGRSRQQRSYSEIRAFHIRHCMARRRPSGDDPAESRASGCRASGAKNGSTAKGCPWSKPGLCQCAARRHRRHARGGAGRRSARLGEVVGNYNCTDGTMGTFELYEISGTISGFSGRNGNSWGSSAGELSIRAATQRREGCPTPKCNPHRHPGRGGSSRLAPSTTLAGGQRWNGFWVLPAAVDR